MAERHSPQLQAKLRDLRLEIETLRLMGHRRLDGALDGDIIDMLKQKITKRGKAAPSSPGAAPEPVIAPAEKEERLASIRADVAACHKCELSKTRTNTVFGVGNPRARLMFIGEAPGADEDKKGEPFVGRAGQLLTRMIEAMGLSRSDVYIANILKCRPPQNRDPLPREVELCEPYLIRQIAVIGPEVICGLGRVAVQTLLKTTTPISRLRGEFHSYHGTPLLATFHPAYLLRNPASKADAWNDLQMVMKRLDIPVPPKGKKGD